MMNMKIQLPLLVFHIEHSNMTHGIRLKKYVSDYGKRDIRSTSLWLRYELLLNEAVEPHVMHDY
jgi:hypothetical protein